MTYAGIIIGLIIIAVVDFFGARAWITPIKVQLTTMAV
jgi:hypothetical protein